VKNGYGLRSPLQIRRVRRRRVFALTSRRPQVHVDICEPELMQAVNVLNLCSPTIIGLCGNSSVYGGAPAPFVSQREGDGASIDSINFRHGMADGPFYSVADWISYLCRFPFLMRPRTMEETWAAADMLQPVRVACAPWLACACGARAIV
jgi:hypothetical protein